MSLDILILAGMLHITAPAAAAPEQYLATAYAHPGEQLQWRGRDNWVAPHLCFDRCGTVPDQANALLAGEIPLQAAADMGLTVWRLDAGRWAQEMHCANFFTGPWCGKWAP